MPCQKMKTAMTPRPPLVAAINVDRRTERSSQPPITLPSAFKATMKATVIAAAGGPEKCALARAHGADHVIDYRAEDLRATVREITGGAGCDVIFDPVGGDSFDTAVRCLPLAGRLIVIGFASGRIPSAPANILLVKNCGVLGFYWGAYRRREPERFRAAFDQLLAWYAEGRLEPHVSQTLPLERAGEALCLLRDRRSTGKVVLVTGG